jgi:methylenetetrahydrofolate reductase (NADPH)
MVYTFWYTNLLLYIPLNTSRVQVCILPITDYQKLLKFSETCGACICKDVHDVFGSISSDMERTVSTGIEYCVSQCEDLLNRGAPGLHFYSLNKVEPVASIWKQVVT